MIAGTSVLERRHTKSTTKRATGTTKNRGLESYTTHETCIVICLHSIAVLRGSSSYVRDAPYTKEQETKASL